MSDPVPYLDGHCGSHGRPDQFHALCPGRFRSQFGVEHACVCPGHLEPNPLTGKGSEPVGMIESGAQSGPESALTDRGQADYLGVDQ